MELLQTMPGLDTAVIEKIKIAAVISFDRFAHQTFRGAIAVHCLHSSFLIIVPFVSSCPLAVVDKSNGIGYA